MKALVTSDFFNFCAKSVGRKTAKEMEKLIRTFVQIAPEFLKIFETGRKIEYISQNDKNSNLSRCKVEEKLNKLLKEKDNEVKKNKV